MLTPLSAQISASKFQNLSQMPLEICGVRLKHHFFSVVFGSNTTRIVVLLTNIILQRAGIRNLAFKHQRKISNPHKDVCAKNNQIQKNSIKRVPSANMQLNVLHEQNFEQLHTCPSVLTFSQLWAALVSISRRFPTRASFHTTFARS